MDTKLGRDVAMHRPVDASNVRLTILRTEAYPALQKFGLYCK